MLTRYYTIWDATPLDEYGKPYLRIGFAKINDNASPPIVDLSNSRTVVIIILISLIIFIGLVFLAYKKRQEL